MTVDRAQPPGATAAIRYPRDFVDELLAILREHDRGSESSRPLPDPETLRVLMDVAFAASMQPDEGRFATFGLGFLAPGEDRKALLQVAFSRPMELCTREVVQLAAAMDSTKTSLAVWGESARNLRIWGLVTSESQPLASSPADGHPTFLLNTPFLLVRARAPGVLYVYHWKELHLLYVRGEAYFRPASGRLQMILRSRAHLDPRDAEAVSQIATRISLLGHGGTILLTAPGLDVPASLLDVPYRFAPASRLLTNAVHRRSDDVSDEKAERLERHALDFVTQLSQVDGAIHLSFDLEVYGFGAMIKSASRPLKLVSEGFGDQDRQPLPWSAIPGTRHRSAAMFCAQQLGEALAIVISQDGDVSLFGRLPDGSVSRMGPFALGAGLAVAG